MDQATREEKLKSAKQKLKQYRARQAKQRRSSISEASSSCITSPTKMSFGSTSQPHRRTSSRSMHSRRSSRTDSLIPKAASASLEGTLAAHSKRQSLSNTIHATPPNIAVQSHARRSSRHSRQFSIGTRKESMDIMSGLIASGSIISNPAFLQAGASPDLLKDLTALSPVPNFPFSSPKTPSSAHLDDFHRRESYRNHALEALEGRPLPVAERQFNTDISPIASTSTSHGPLPVDGGVLSPTMAFNKRSSWGSSAATAMALQGGRGAQDLGMLVEEEEEEEEDVQDASSKKSSPSNKSIPLEEEDSPSPVKSSGAARMSLISPQKPHRHRPASLMLSSSNSISLGSAIDPSSPLDNLTSETLDTAITTPGSLASYAFKPLRNLSLSAIHTPSSAHSIDAFQSSANPTSTRLSKNTSSSGQKTPGLKSLTLTSPAIIEGMPNTPQRRRSSIQVAPAAASNSSVSSNSTNSRQRRGSSAALSSRRMSYRSNSNSTLNLDDAPCFERLVMAGDEDESFASSHDDYNRTGDASQPFTEGNSTIAQAHVAEIASLKIQIDALQTEASTLRTELSSTKFQLSSLQTENEKGLSLLEKRTGEEARALTYKLFELEGQLEAKKAELLTEQESAKLEVNQLQAAADELRSRLDDVTSERDELREDVDGWRMRCGDLERNIKAERTAKDEERKELLITREKARKLSDRLAALQNNTANQSAPSDDAALAAAQAKLIGEMRDQIFSMAAALDSERKEKQSQSTLISHLQQQLQKWTLPSLKQEPPTPIRAHTDSDASRTSSLNRSQSSSFQTEMTEDTSVAAETAESPSFPKGSLGLSINFSGLNAVVEEDEEETSIASEVNAVLDESAWTDDGDEVPELDFQGTQSKLEARMNAGKLGSNASSIDEPMPITPCRESPLVTDLPVAAESARHTRSDSFIKQWTFPKGPVELVHIVEPEDHSFFSICTSEVLPALPVSKDVMDLPEFFSSEISLDEEVVRKSLDDQVAPQHVRRPSSPRPRSQRLSPMRTSFSNSTGGPPPARSARYSAALSEVSNGSSWSASAAVAKAPSRMSLQGISSLISSYVVPNNAPVGPRVASAAANLCAAHTKEDSIFADDHIALLRPTSVIAPMMSKRSMAPFKTATPSKPRTLTKAEQPIPVASSLGILNFISSFGLSSNQVIRV